MARIREQKTPGRSKTQNPKPSLGSTVYSASVPLFEDYWILLRQCFSYLDFTVSTWIPCGSYLHCWGVIWAPYLHHVVYDLRSNNFCYWAFIWSRYDLGSVRPLSALFGIFRDPLDQFGFYLVSVFTMCGPSGANSTTSTT